MTRLGDLLAGYSYCWSHQQMEHIPLNAYEVCYECGHVWTARALRRAWHREYPMPKLAWRSDRFVSDNLIGWLRHARHRWFKRASRIRFCPECIHDF